MVCKVSKTHGLISAIQIHDPHLLAPNTRWVHVIPVWLKSLHFWAIQPSFLFTQVVNLLYKQLCFIYFIAYSWKFYFWTSGRFCFCERKNYRSDLGIYLVSMVISNRNRTSRLEITYTIRNLVLVGEQSQTSFSYLLAFFYDRHRQAQVLTDFSNIFYS